MQRLKNYSILSLTIATLVLSSVKRWALRFDARHSFDEVFVACLFGAETIQAKQRR
jgi:hypothetical protein